MGKNDFKLMIQKASKKQQTAFINRLEQNNAALLAQHVITQKAVAAGCRYCGHAERGQVEMNKKLDEIKDEIIRATPQKKELASMREKLARSELKVKQLKLAHHGHSKSRKLAALSSSPSSTSSTSTSSTSSGVQRSNKRRKCAPVDRSERVKKAEADHVKSRRAGRSTRSGANTRSKTK